MLLQRIPHPGAPAKSTGLPVALYLIVIALTSNLNGICPQCASKLYREYV